MAFTLVAEQSQLRCGFLSARNGAGIPPGKWLRATERVLRRRQSGNEKEDDRGDVVQIVNERVIPRLQELDLAKDYTSKTLQKHYRTDELCALHLQEDIDLPTIAKFSEHDVGLPGVEISVKPVRQYVYGALAAHLLGYVGAPLDINVLPDIKDYSYYQPDVDGKSQIEPAWTSICAANPASASCSKNVKGVIEGEDRVDPPNRVTTSISRSTPASR